MHAITDADREAARALREALADISGFWFRPGDEGPLAAALARHRIEAEQRLADKLVPFMKDAVAEPAQRQPAAACQRELNSPAANAWGPFLA